MIIKIQDAYINLKYVTDVDTSGKDIYWVYMVHGNHYNIPKVILPIADFIEHWEHSLK